MPDSSKFAIWTEEVRARLSSLRLSPARESDIVDELSQHLDDRWCDLIAGGASPEEAMRLTLAEFRGRDVLAKYMAPLRQSHAPQPLAASAPTANVLTMMISSHISWMDLKLGFRMLVKYPGLTLIGGLAMAFAISIGAAAFEFLNQRVSPTLPLNEGHRIVGIRLWDSAATDVEKRALYDYANWRGQLQSIENLGVFRTVDRNLIGSDVPGEPVMTAEITASGFTVARVPAMMGRALVEADEQPGAPAVAVIAHDIWRTRFENDPAIVGRAVQVGTVMHTIVGVMPEGFAFPRSHSLWIPFRLSDLQLGRREGPPVYVFGRLADSVSLVKAQAELTTLGTRAAAESPDTHERIRPQVLPYVEAISPPLFMGPILLRAINLFFVMLLALVCANVALLMFARAAARSTELAVRTALGASWGRIAGQLFAEALALGSVALVAGLSTAGFVLRWHLGIRRIESGGVLPFWHNDSLGTATIVYAVLLMLLGAAIAGIVPALKATGRGLETRLRQVSGRGGGMQFGGIWTAVIVMQVAFTVALPPAAYLVRQSVVDSQTFDPGFADERYLSARLEMDAEFPSTRYEAASLELARRLSIEPDVAGVTFADRLPRAGHPRRPIEIEGGLPNAPADAVPRPGIAFVGVDFFDVLGAGIQSGRGFTAADLLPQAGTVIVNASFVRHIVGARNPIGLRMRELPDQPGESAPGPWLEIVGVAPDLGVNVIAGEQTDNAGYYRPAAAGSVLPSNLIVHVRGDLPAVATRLHAVAAEVDPALRLHNVARMSDGDPTGWLEFDALFKLLTVVSAIALLLSLAGISAVMSFTVARRTREIGIRVALGATPASVLRATFSRPLMQVALGVVIGTGLTAALVFAVSGGASVTGGVLVAAYATLIMGVCLLPSITPVRRALRVDATDALRGEE